MISGIEMPERTLVNGEWTKTGKTVPMHEITFVTDDQFRTKFVVMLNPSTLNLLPEEGKSGVLTLTIKQKEFQGKRTNAIVVDSFVPAAKKS